MNAGAACLECKLALNQLQGDLLIDLKPEFCVHIKRNFETGQSEQSVE